MGSHHEHDIYRKNLGACSLQTPIPLAPKKGMPLPINTYDDVDEPRFDPSIHLDLDYPDYVRIFPDFKKADRTPTFTGHQTGSRFAYSAPFQIFTEEGIRVLRKIIEREECRAVSPKNARGSKYALRGLYYLSPFVRDVQECQLLRDHFHNIAGEELIPHPNLSSSPQVNLSVDGCEDGPVDIWHWDSVAYTGVVLLNNVESMQGGKLEFMRHDKHVAMRRLANKDANLDNEVIGYQHAGKMILAQGSEVLHHVTPVTSTTRRISLIFGYSPANSFQPPKTVLGTMRRVDVVHNLADYEFFREKAWQSLFCLKYFVENTTYSDDGKSLGPKLRSVAMELLRSADILESKVEDVIQVFDEFSGKLETNYTSISQVKAKNDNNRNQLAL